MLKKFLLVFTLLPLFVSAQEPNKLVRRDSLPDQIHLFYNHFGLNMDSAADPQLFLTVFDWIGTKYKYAGDCKSGIDCSGFVSEMYSQVYCMEISGGSKDLFTKVDTVAKANLKEGDILFFKIKKGQISHVAIYLGNNKFAHASVHGGVMVNDLNEEYYKKYFYCGGRIKEVKKAG
ncbi:MAG: NlpC/P60 family protein [Bacteroidota bacterium]|nr:NlpC/P60 family protein [Bacteroidota bacterium]